MHGKMPQSGLIEITLWMFFLVVWGQCLALLRPEPPQGAQGRGAERRGVGGGRVVSDAAPAGLTAAAFPVY